MTVRSIAEALEISKSAAGRFAKAGMPKDNAEAARAWLKQNGSRLQMPAVGRPKRAAVPRETNTVLRASRVSATGGETEAPPGQGAVIDGHAPGIPNSTPPSDVGGKPPGAGGAAPPPGNPDLAHYAGERATRERIKREREEMALEQMRGSLIRVDQAQRAAFTVFRGLRDACENIALRIKDQIAAETDPFTVQAMLEHEVRSVFSGFDVRAAVQEVDDEDDDEAAEA